VNLDQHLLLVHHLHDLADVRTGLSLKIEKNPFRYNLTFLLFGPKRCSAPSLISMF
jgi:hypothetical protein